MAATRNTTQSKCCVDRSTQHTVAGISWPDMMQRMIIEQSNTKSLNVSCIEFKMTYMLYLCYVYMSICIHGMFKKYLCSFFHLNFSSFGLYYLQFYSILLLFLIILFHSFLIYIPLNLILLNHLLLFTIFHYYNHHYFYPSFQRLVVDIPRGAFIADIIKVMIVLCVMYLDIWWDLVLK